MIGATFRFYAQLNDFLPVPRRQRRFTHVLPARASVKDTIEALGVPHPEVDVIIVNGHGERFAYLLRDGDDVAVYPVFRRLDLGSLVPTTGNPPLPVRFVLDVHLGKLARLLRLFGFDTVVADEDREVAENSARQGRVALTRDIGLLKRAVVTHGYWVRHTAPERQLVEVLDRFGLAGDMEPFARCLRCNTAVLDADADAIAGRLPPRTREHFQQFRRCPSCDRIYWQGSHYGRLLRLVERTRERLATSPRT